MSATKVRGLARQEAGASVSSKAARALARAARAGLVLVAGFSILLTITQLGARARHEMRDFQSAPQLPVNARTNRATDSTRAG